ARVELAQTMGGDPRRVAFFAHGRARRCTQRLPRGRARRYDALLVPLRIAAFDAMTISHAMPTRFPTQVGGLCRLRAMSRIRVAFRSEAGTRR
ncbi:MAG: hypothetical protein KJ018_13915, partial [Burkholderiales bacterium]|nr:hypothetical protein [Burkholderiales bacterium]